MIVYFNVLLSIGQFDEKICLVVTLPNFNIQSKSKLNQTITDF